MLVVTSYHPGDADQALRQAQWIEELGGAKGHELLLIIDSRCFDPAQRESFERSFDSVEVLSFVDHFNQWPQAPNAIFAMAARHIMRTRPQPWLFLEPDCIPMRSGWLDALAEEYRAGGKPFLGDFVSVHTPELDVEDHMSGNGIYPADMFTHAGTALIAGDLAWDVVAAEQILPAMHTSKLLLHAWKHPRFENYEQVEREIFAIKPECVLFHASKDGSLIDILRAERNKTLPAVPALADPNANADTSPEVIAGAAIGEARESATDNRGSVGCELPNSLDSRGGGQFNLSGGVEIPQTRKPDGPASADETRSIRGMATANSESCDSPAQFICDILIKSYPPDYELLGYCLRSIEKFATGFRRVVLIVPSDHPPAEASVLRNKTLALVPVKETGEGYLFQQAVKINAHEYTDADYILHIDSDTVLTKPVTPQTFFRDGFEARTGRLIRKPIWLMTPYSKTETPWQPFTEKFLGEPVEFEFMRRFPMLIPRSLHVSADVFCRVRHKMSLAQYILSQPHRAFSEFNALGALAYSRARDDFYWLDTTKEPLPELVAWQRWSHEPLTDEIRAKLEEILSGGVERDVACDSEVASQRRHARDRDGEARTDSIGSDSSRSESSASPAQKIRQTKEGIWIIDGDTHISKWVEEKGQLQHDFQTLPLILEEIHSGDVVVDVGANIGDTTGPFLDFGAHVIAFEPHNEAFECLKRNCPAATVYNVALGFVEDETSMRFDMNIGASHLAEKGQQLVRVMSLDFYHLDKCDFIKIDVEGYELNALLGAEETIARFRPKMAIEVNECALERQGTNAAELFFWLAEHDYQWWPLVPPDRNQPSPQYDILCRPVEPRARPEKITEKPDPWSNQLESEQRIQELCAELKTFCSSPRRTSKVRDELAFAHVIPALSIERQKRRKRLRQRESYHRRKAQASRTNS